MNRVHRRSPMQGAADKPGAVGNVAVKPDLDDRLGIDMELDFDAAFDALAVDPYRRLCSRDDDCGVADTWP
jgi:hypothetical protein